MLLLLRSARRRALRKHQTQHTLRKWQMRCAVWQANTRKLQREVNHWREEWGRCVEYSENLRMLCLKAFDTMITFEIPVPAELKNVTEWHGCCGVGSNMLIQTSPLKFHLTGFRACFLRDTGARGCE